MTMAVKFVVFTVVILLSSFTNAIVRPCPICILIRSTHVQAKNWVFPQRNRAHSGVYDILPCDECSPMIHAIVIAIVIAFVIAITIAIAIAVATTCVLTRTVH